MWFCELKLKQSETHLVSLDSPVINPTDVNLKACLHQITCPSLITDNLEGF